MTSVPAQSKVSTGVFAHISYDLPTAGFHTLPGFCAWVFINDLSGRRLGKSGPQVVIHRELTRREVKYGVRIISHISSLSHISAHFCLLPRPCIFSHLLRVSLVIAFTVTFHTPRMQSVSKKLVSRILQKTGSAFFWFFFRPSAQAQPISLPYPERCKVISEHVFHEAPFSIHLCLLGMLEVKGIKIQQ